MTMTALLAPFTWLLPLICGLFEGWGQYIGKVSGASKWSLLAGGFLFGIPFWAVWLWLDGMPEIQSSFYWVVPLHATLNAIGVMLLLTAVRLSPLMLSSTYLAMTPAFLLIVSPLIGAGTPTMIGGLGVFILTICIYTINLKEGGQKEGRRIGWLDPFKNLAKEPGSLIMLLVALIFAFTGSLDVRGIEAASKPLYLLVDYGFIGVIGLVGEIVRQRLSGEKPNFSPWILLYGVAMTATFFFQMLAIGFLLNAPYVFAGKRAGTIAFTTIQGIRLGRSGEKKYEREAENLSWRIPSIVGIVVGMILIIFFGKN